MLPGAGAPASPRAVPGFRAKMEAMDWIWVVLIVVGWLVLSRFVGG
jgi:hypothetical protein